MTTFVVVLLLVGLAVWLSAARPSLSTQPVQDRDQERQLDELRSLSGSRADVHM